MIDTATKVKITIDKEFSALIPAMAAHEREQLEKNLVAERGARDPIIVWEFNEKLILLDGHNRYEVCRKHGLGYPVKRKKFFDRNAARNWVIENQLGRRNITDEQRRYLLGKLWQETSKSDGGRPKTSATVAVVSEAPVTAETIAAAHGVSERTVHNAAEFAETVDAIGDKSPELKAAILSGEVQASAADLEAIAEAPKRKVESVAKKVAAGNAKAVKEAVQREPGDDTDTIKADKAKRRGSGKESISPKDRKAALSAFGVVSRFFDKTGRHDEYREHLIAVLEGIKA